ncbi:MAG: foldase protein PrsA [Bacilli bacterium]
MKNRRLAFSLVTLASVAALAGCGEEVTAKDGLVLTFTDANGEVTEYEADDLYAQYLEKTNGLDAYFSAVYEVLVRNLFKEQTLKEKELYNKADKRVEEVKATAKSNKETNKSTYDKEMEALLKSHNVEDLDELREKFAFEAMSEEVEKQYYDSETSWADGAWTALTRKYLDESFPYHIKHILVKVSDQHNSIYNGALSAAEAKKIASVIKRIAVQRSSESFGSIALEQSEDTGSANKNGDLGIMDRSTSFVPEFKLGIYAYDSIFSNVDATNKLGLPTVASDYLDAKGLGEIPYSAALKLEEYAEVETDDDGLKINDGKPLYFPRNVVFNKYFNRHLISVITPNVVDAATNPDDLVGVEDATYAAMPGFQVVPELSNKKVLCDEKGNPVLAVRAGAESSYEGIHLIVIERSALVEIDNEVSLSDYYTTKIPGSAEYPTDPNTGENLDTYVNYLTRDDREYRVRAKAIEDKIKAFDVNVKYTIYEMLLAHENVTFKNEALGEAIANYIMVKRSTKVYDDHKSYRNDWENYIEYLENADYWREKRLVSEGCAIKFVTAGANDPAFKEGGECYAAK